MRIKSSDGSQLKQNDQDFCKRVKLGIEVVYRWQKETLRHVLNFCREAPFSSPSRKLYLSGEVYSRLAKQSCPTASKLRAFALHACVEQSSPCLATAWQ